MFRSIWEDIKREYQHGNMVTRLVIINVAVFLLVNLVWVFLRVPNDFQTPSVYNEMIRFFAISSDWLHLLLHPWSLLTHMFLHEGFLHMLFNMLFLYWFGRIVGDFIGDHRILPLYLMAGLASAFSFFVSSFFISSGDFALGASGAVMGVVVAAAAIAPDYNIRLLFLGNVPLKYIAAAMIVFDIISIGMNANTGGHFGHLGGAVFGWIFIRRLQEGDDLAAPVNQLLQRIKAFFSGLGQDANQKNKKRKGPRVAYRNPDKPKRRNENTTRKTENGLSHQEQLDYILDKIKDDGYESLSQTEKEFLFNASKK